MLIATDKPMPARRAHDLYPTPHALIESALDLIPEEPERLLDIGGFDGRWGHAARERWTRSGIAGVEIQPLPKPEAYNGWMNASFPECAEGISVRFDLIGFNPPFSNVENIIRAAIDLLTPDGRLMFLLPLTFLASQGRAKGLFRELPPYAVHVCSKRPSFSGDGKTNATEFGIFLWSRNYCHSPALHWLRP